MLPWSWVAESGYARSAPAEFGAAVEARCRGAPQRERVEPDARADPAGVRSAVPERERDHAVRHAGQNPDGKLQRAARVIDTDHVPARDTERLGRLRAHERGVVPRQLRERIGKLLQPPVVRVSTVVQRRGRKEHDLETRRSASAAPRRALPTSRASSARAPRRDPARLREARCRQAVHRAGRDSTSCRTRPRPGSVSTSPARCRGRDDPRLPPSAPALQPGIVRRTAAGSAAGRR